MGGAISRTRDKNGWRVPTEGTLSREIYEFVLRGWTPAVIAKRLKCKSNTVRVLIHRFKHPERTNAWNKRRGPP